MRYFLAQPVRTDELFVFASELYLGDYETFIVSVKLIYLVVVVSYLRQVACLVNHASAQFHHLARFIYGNFLLPFETAHSVGWSLDCQESASALYTYAHCAVLVKVEVALNYLY